MLTPFLEIKELTEKCETNETETKQNKKNFVIIVLPLRLHLV